MPTYDYLCEACGHQLEIFQSMSSAPKRKCPECSKLKLKRQIGMGAGVIFKGSGFYQTDYRSDSYTKGAKAEAEAKQPKPDASDAKKAGAAKKKPSDKKKDPS